MEGSGLNMVSTLAANLMILLIRKYQTNFSHYFYGKCRFIPSCSDYGILAFQKYGLLKGFKLTAKRFFKCRPPYGGIDPVN